MLPPLINSQSATIAAIQMTPCVFRPGMLMLKAWASAKNPMKSETPALARNR